MGLETGTTIADLVATNPTAADPRSEGDDHIRLIKAVLKNDVISKSAGTDGNLKFTGTGNRITGDFNNATPANRVAFQASTAGDTFVSAITNGGVASSGFFAYNEPSLANSQWCGFAQLATESRIWSSYTGTPTLGTYLPMTFYTGGAERMRIDTSGNVKLSSANPLLFSDGPIGIQSGGTSSIKIYTAGGTERFAWDNTGNSLHTTAGGGLGYGTGAGGTVTQTTSKSTAVTLNKPCGKITMNNAALAAGATVTFLFNNSLATQNDNLTVTIDGGTVAGATAYNVWATTAGGGGIYVVCLKNISAGSLSEAVAINFALGRNATA